MTRKRLAIIGGGPGGLATARVFLANAEHEFDIQLFTNDLNVGGLWYYPHGDSRPGRVMYDHLETNLPKNVMQFRDVPFEPHWFRYPRRHEVWVYLKRYYNQFIRDDESVKVHLSSEVTNVAKNTATGTWNLKVVDHANKDKTTDYEFEYVVVATGHFSVPNIPKDVSGLDEWFEKGDAIHSMHFYDCEIAQDKKVLVVGDGSSGQDIVNQCASVAERVYQSVVSNKNTERFYDADPIVEVVDKIASVDWSSKTVILVDGTVLKDISKLIYASGFLYDLKIFEDKLRANLLPHNNSGSLTSNYVNNLWQQIFYTKDSTLAFSLLPQLIVPFPIAESQACLIVKAFTGKLIVPKISESKFDHLPNGHNLPDGQDVEYGRELQSILDSVSDAAAPDNFQPVQWTEYFANERAITAGEKFQRSVQLNKYSQESRAKKEKYHLIQFVKGPPPKGTEAAYP